ncbi:RNA polymerase sigma factor [Patescibacteria group bacterium]
MKQKINQKTDQELVELALNNSDDFLYLMKRYEKPLLKYILRLTNINTDDAEDILQEVFIKIYQNLNNYDTSLKFSSWIYRITHNQVISNWRKLKSRGQDILFELDENILNNIIDEFNIANETENKLLKNSIFKILNKLNIKYREVLILKFIEEKTYQEMSDILKKPQGTIATLINRAKKQFKDEALKQKINLS